MESEKLRKDSIAQPELWSLVLELGKDRLIAGLFPPTKQETPITETIALNEDAPSMTKAIEEAIYDNPLLLSNFKRIICLLSTEKFMIAPSTDDEETITNYFESLFPNHGELMWSNLSGGNEMLIYEGDEKVVSFLKRTFFGVKIAHRMHALTEYIKQWQSGTGEQITINEWNGHADIISFRDGNLLMANSFPIKSTADEIYFVAAVKEAFGLNEPEISVRANRDGDKSVGELSDYFPNTKAMITAEDLLFKGRQSHEASLTLTAAMKCE